MGLTAVIEAAGSTPDLPNLLVLTGRPTSPNSIHQLVSNGVYLGREHILVAKGVTAPRAARRAPSAPALGASDLTAAVIILVAQTTLSETWSILLMLRAQTERALQIDEKVYGPDHPTVATIANNLGQILQARGDLAGAQRQTERALQIFRNVYGPDNPRTISLQEALKNLKK